MIESEKEKEALYKDPEFSFVCFLKTVKVYKMGFMGYIMAERGHHECWIPVL